MTPAKSLIQPILDRIEDFRKRITHCHPKIHRLISGIEEGRGFGRIPDHQEGVRCKAARSDE
jgi:hypothetical protein